MSTANFTAYELPEHVGFGPPHKERVTRIGDNLWRFHPAVANEAAMDVHAATQQQETPTP